MEIGELELSCADEMLGRIAPMMRSGGTVLVSLTFRQKRGEDFDQARAGNDAECTWV
jgi:hypothetical protein